MISLYSNKVFIDGRFQAATVDIKNGMIVGFHSGKGSNAEIADYGDLVIMPGMVDTHVHINEPGRTEWEGFATATQAALAGGVTTVVDMPLNCIPVTTSLTAFKAKLQEIRGKKWVDCAFHGGIIPGSTGEVEPLIDAGVKTFKVFLIDSGIDEFPAVDIDTLDLAMPILSRRGIPLIVHAELDLGGDKVVSDPQSYDHFLKGRPKKWENKAVEKMIALSRKHQCKVHIVHLSSAEAVVMIREAKKQGVKISAETCPHYLTLCSEEIPDGDGRFKCAPPIREKQNQEILWCGLVEGDIDFIVSDHSPCTPALKMLSEKNLVDAWGGISSLQFGLPLIWSEMLTRKIPIDRLVGWLCEGPAALVGLTSSKGAIKAGADADLVIWNPDASFILEKKVIRYRHKISPYEGRKLYGKIEQVFLRGESVYDPMHYPHEPFRGKPKGRNLL